MGQRQGKERRYWLDDPRNVDRIIRVLGLLCVGLLLVELFYTRESHFGFESWFGFFAWYGFLSYVFIVLSAKLLRRLVRRDEDYYDD